MENNSVRNLQCGPKTRLIRGMYGHVMPRYDKCNHDTMIKIQAIDKICLLGVFTVTQSKCKPFNTESPESRK